jgi:23S rRNA pseudouridine1911/1915/1917 synthase
MTSPLPVRLTATVGSEHDGERLYRYLGQRFPEISRARFQTLIANGEVSVEGAAILIARRKIKVGEEIAVNLPVPADPIPLPESIPLKVVYEDADLIVIDKPAGLVAHPSAGHGGGTLVNALLAHCGESLSGIGGSRRPGIVHRLDKDTSGLMVVAKNDFAHRALSEQFAAHGRDGRLKREYQAIVWGTPQRRRGKIDAPLGRSTADRKKIAVSQGRRRREAITHYEVVETFGKPAAATLLRCSLETGRTHQIRVHMAHIGHPLLGDPAYGKGFSASASKLSPSARVALNDLARQALHASLLGFDHPRSGLPVFFRSELPPDMSVLLDALRQT